VPAVTRERDAVVTHMESGLTRRSSYRSLSSLQRDNRRCQACAEAGFPLGSLAVFEGLAEQRAMIIGQAPGIVEGEQRRPWRGRAGATLRRWLAMDEDEFYATFYCCSVTRCYPGRSPGGRGDRTPTEREIALCRLWLDWEMRLVRPSVVLTVGGLAARETLGITRLTDHVGVRHALGEAVTIPLPHPSGASGWLNVPENRERLASALVVVQDELSRVRG
jgi:uracil-DNA glycosylase family 4